MNNTLVGDRVFQSLSVPLQPEQEAELEKRLLQEGCIEPVTAWNGVIIDGYKRHRICTAEGIDFDFREMKFPSEEEAVSWVCRKRIPEYPKHSVPYRYLVGRLYNAQKEIYREVRKQPEDMRTIQLNPEWDRVSYYIAEEFSLHHATIENHGTYAIWMEQIADKAWPLFEAILSGTIAATRKEIGCYAEMDVKQLTELYRTRWGLEDGKESALRIRTRKKRQEMETRTNEIPLKVGVKDMPAYDPDMELRGLTLTISAWIMAISRVKKKTDQATENGKEQLARNLIRLEGEIDELLGVMGYGRVCVDRETETLHTGCDV